MPACTLGELIDRFPYYAPRHLVVSTLGYSDSAHETRMYWDHVWGSWVDTPWLKTMHSTLCHDPRCT